MKELWEFSILQCINSTGKEVCLKEIYDKINKFVKLKPEHLKKQYGRPAYQHQIRRHITNLRRSGDLIWKSRGHYSLTEKGRVRLKSIHR